jgi:hypothetical protein
MDGNCVSVGVGEGERPPEWTIEGLGHDWNPGLYQSIVQALRIIALEPQRDAPAETLDRRQVDGGLTHGKEDGTGGKDDRSRWALGGPLKAELLRIERGRHFQVADLQCDEIRSYHSHMHSSIVIRLPDNYIR